MIILGIDPGLAHTGWGVVETRGTTCRARAYGCIATKASEPIDVRLGRICRTLGEVIEKYGPTELAIESIYFGENTKSAIATAQARRAEPPSWRARPPVSRWESTLPCRSNRPSLAPVLRTSTRWPTW